jgi:NAD(P)-dependent dehydrogenase (short-subunit alcohol dehydrogenase family)
MPDRIRLDGRVAVVTGAAGVIGTATIKLLAERGARIVAVDRKEADLKAAIKDLPASAEALAVTADVTSEEEVADYVRAAVDRFGTIDAFYNNAGVEGDINGTGVRVNCVWPGLIDSRMLSTILQSRSGGKRAAAHRQDHRLIPARRLDRRPVASIVAFWPPLMRCYVSGRLYGRRQHRTAA